MVVMHGCSRSSREITSWTPADREFDIDNEPDRWMSYSTSYGALMKKPLQHLHKLEIDHTLTAWPPKMPVRTIVIRLTTRQDKNHWFCVITSQLLRNFYTILFSLQDLGISNVFS
jgi:hypothetical protein